MQGCQMQGHDMRLCVFAIGAVGARLFNARLLSAVGESCLLGLGEISISPSLGKPCLPHWDETLRLPYTLGVVSRVAGIGRRKGRNAGDRHGTMCSLSGAMCSLSQAGKTFPSKNHTLPWLHHTLPSLVLVWRFESLFQSSHSRTECLTYV